MTTAPSPLPSPPDFTLSQLMEDSRPILNKEAVDIPSDSASAEFVFDFQTEAGVDDQFHFFPESPSPPTPEHRWSDTDAHDQTSLMNIASPPRIDCNYPTQDVEYQNGAISSYGFGDSSSMPLLCPDNYAVSFQVTQFLEVAKQKEHAARLLQEAAKCREYAVHSLLPPQSAWSVPSSTYSFDSFPTGATHSHGSDQVMWDSQGTAVWHPVSSMPTALPAT